MLDWLSDGSWVEDFGNRFVADFSEKLRQCDRKWKSGNIWGTKPVEAIRIDGLGILKLRHPQISLRSDLVPSAF
jgi:hypothetical protein